LPDRDTCPAAPSPQHTGFDTGLPNPANDGRSEDDVMQQSFSGGGRSLRAAGLLAGLAFLAACNQTAPVASAPPAAEPARASLVTPAGFRLPEGTGCRGELARFRAVQANDLETGHVGRSVHDRIGAELTQAEAQCAAGNEGAALAALRATKSRYGYP
jgi:hypothetical protein